MNAQLVAGDGIAAEQFATIAGTAAADPVAAALRSHRIATIIGEIGFDDRGDLIGADWVWYEWRNSNYAPWPAAPEGG